MAASVRLNREELEEAVRLRTQQLESIAYLDSMCGILNRRGAADAFAQVKAGSGDDTATGFILIDIDNFKEFNDAHGHRAGDAVVVAVANRLLSGTGVEEYCARWGGDEFVVILPDCSERQLAEMLRDLHAHLVFEPVDLPDGSSLPITVSMGAGLSPRSESLDDAAHRADIALYRAKRNGRNRWAIQEKSQHKAVPAGFAVA